MSASSTTNNTRPRKLSRALLAERYQLECAIDPATRTVKVPEQWRRQHLRPLTLVAGLPAVWLHSEALPRFARWAQLIGERGLASRIVSVDGGFVARLMRGADVAPTADGLSFHTYGVAVDINARTNRQGTRGAQLGQRGCVLELVPLAYEAGLYWGGDFGGARCDPMHFEAAE